MTFAGWLTIILFVVILSVLALPLGTYLSRSTRVSGVPLTVIRRPDAFSTASCEWTASAGRTGSPMRKACSSSHWWLDLPVCDPAHPGRLLRTARLNPLGYHSPLERDVQHGVSFMTNTNWQYYGGEATMSYLSQMIGLTVQNWLSAGVGIVVAVALVRGSSGAAARASELLEDMVRTILYVLARSRC